MRSVCNSGDCRGLMVAVHLFAESDDNGADGFGGVGEAAT